MGKPGAEFNPGWPESDDALIDVLLAVASGDRSPASKTDSAARLASAKFSRLVKRALEGPDQLWKDLSELDVRRFGISVKVGIQDGPSGRPRIAYRREFKNLAAALSYGVVLLLDPLKPYGASLSQCVHCKRYYRARRNPKGGPANRFYCTPAHRRAAHDSATARAKRKDDAAKPRKHK